MSSRLSRVLSNHRHMPVPVMLYMLELIESETHDDTVLAGVSRTLAQAIDELSALQQAAREVIVEADCLGTGNASVSATARRRLC